MDGRADGYIDELMDGSKTIKDSQIDKAGYWIYQAISMTMLHQSIQTCMNEH